MEKLRCQRTGCEALFTEDENREDSCRYHDSPIFHDGMKEWSCCKRKSHDFSLFIALPGCKKGKHTTEKPVLPKKAPAPKQPVYETSATINSSSKDSCPRCCQGFLCSDHEFLHGLTWSELTMRSNRANAEAAFLNAEVTFRASNLWKQFSKDSRVFEATSTELKKKLADLTSSLEKESANAKRREADMRQGFEAELLKLKNELRVVEARLEASREETRDVKMELTLAQLDAESARAELSKGAEVLKEAFLKSGEFEEIIGDKALGFLDVAFDGCVAQFKLAGYPPEGTSADFLSVKKIVDNLSPDR